MISSYKSNGYDETIKKSFKPNLIASMDEISTQSTQKSPTNYKGKLKILPLKDPWPKNPFFFSSPFLLFFLLFGLQVSLS